MVNKPEHPFEVKFVQAGPGEVQVPARWAIPFDETFRAIEIPNAPAGAVPAFTSIGWHVVNNALRYSPAYKIVDAIDFKVNGSASQVTAWEQKTSGALSVTDRASRTAVILAAGFSHMEAVISWFVREHNHEGLVLCHDRAKSEFYCEPQRPELRVLIGSDGREAADGEGTASHYLIDNHPNAVMMYEE